MLGVYTDRVPARFSGMDENWQNKFLEAMKWEDSQLRFYTEKCQFSRWYDSTYELAQKIVTEAYDMETALNGKEAGANGHVEEPVQERLSDGLL